MTWRSLCLSVYTILVSAWPSNTTGRYMMTSSNRNISALLSFRAGNSPATGEFPAQRPVMQSFDVFYDLHLNKRLSKQSWGWWFEMLSWSLWRHHNDIMFWLTKLMSPMTPDMWVLFSYISNDNTMFLLLSSTIGMCWNERYVYRYLFAAIFRIILVTFMFQELIALERYIYHYLTFLSNPISP